MWYEHVINECFSENMNIARVSTPSGLQKHIFVGLFTIETCSRDGLCCTCRYDACTLSKEEGKEGVLIEALIHV